MNIKKRLATGLTAVMFFACAFPINANSATKLTLEEAIKTAKTSNLQLERTTTQADEYDEKLTEGIDVPPEASLFDPTAGLKASISMRQLQSDLDMTKLSKEAQEEAISLGIKNLFFEIEEGEKNAALIEKQLVQKRKEQNINTLRYKLGVMSKIDFDNSALELEKLNQSKTENNLHIQLSYQNLAKLMGQKTIEKKIDYTKNTYKTLKQRDISIEAKALQASDMAPSIYAQNEQVKFLEERLSYGLFDTGENVLPDELQKTSLKMQDIDLRIAKQNIENAVLETGNQTLQLEENIEKTKLQLENLTFQKKNIKSLVDTGYKTQIELDAMSLQEEALKFQLESMMRNHEILAERLQKSYLISLNY